MPKRNRTVINILASRKADASADMEELSASIIRLGGAAEAMVVKALKAFSRRDTVLAREVRVEEKNADKMQLDLEREAFRILTTYRLNEEQLRFILGAIKMAADLERVGDLADNIARRTILLSNDVDPTWQENIHRMGRLVTLLLHSVLDAFSERDLDKASSVWLRDLEVDQHYDALVRDLVILMGNEQEKINSGTHLLFVAKNLERIGDHATNLAETLHFIETGDQDLARTPRKGIDLRGEDEPS